jgi:hypothetical protein
MERPENNQGLTNDLILNVSGKRKKFKAGSELVSSVNMVDLSYDVSNDEHSELFEMKLHLKQAYAPGASVPTKTVVK